MNNFSLGTPVNMAPTGIASFAKSPICTDLCELNADIAVIGAPFDLTIQGRTGARLGPRGIRTASTRFSYKPGGSYDPQREKMYMDSDHWMVVDCGDVDYVPGNADASFNNLTAAMRLISERGALPVVLGGDHSVTYPAIMGLDSIGRFDIIHFDAHLDWTRSVGGQVRSNGSPMRNCSALPYIGRIIHIGIRGIGSSGPMDYADAKANGDVIYSPKQIRECGIEQALQNIGKGARVYVTFDIDAMDAACAPATGSPMFGGLWYDEVVDMFEVIASRCKVIGMDMVEVAPPYDDPSGTTCYLAARLISDLLGFITDNADKVR